MEPVINPWLFYLIDIAKGIKAVSLFAKILTDPNGAILPWVQPDSTNPYMKGDRVTFDGKTYESTIDSNVWSPRAYPAGWREV